MCHSSGEQVVCFNQVWCDPGNIGWFEARLPTQYCLYLPLCKAIDYAESENPRRELSLTIILLVAGL